MKKVFLLATAVVMVTGIAFADNGKKKTKKCAKAKSSCTKSSASATKSCCKDKKTAEM